MEQSNSQVQRLRSSQSWTGQRVIDGHQILILIALGGLVEGLPGYS
jgi:hypothetical protein